MADNPGVLGPDLWRAVRASAAPDPRSDRPAAVDARADGLGQRRPRIGVGPSRLPSPEAPPSYERARARRAGQRRVQDARAQRREQPTARARGAPTSRVETA